MNRDLWTQGISPLKSPAYPCPSCKGGTMRLQKESLVTNETPMSKRNRRHEDWDPTLIEEMFTARLRCSNSACISEVAIAGVGGLEEVYDADEHGSFTLEPRYYPRFAWPPLSVISIPKRTPKSVRGELIRAFALYWADPGAAAGRVRVSLELLLDALGVQRRKRNVNGRLADLSLHQRLLILGKAEPEAGAQLMAVKWLGNSGSHGSDVSKADLLDALELVEHALAELVEKRSKRMAELAGKLARKHAPPKRRPLVKLGVITSKSGKRTT